MKQKRIFIHWAKYDSRSASLAYHLGADTFFVQSLGGHSKVLAPVKYILNTIMTIQRLSREAPETIFVANPPIFAVLAVWIYSFFRPCCFIVDTHSSTFTARPWAIFLWLYRLMSKRALLHILHNDVLEQKVSSWGVRTVNFGELIYQIDADKEPYPLRKGFNVVFVSLFRKDEPLESVMGAARIQTLVNFYVTGSLAKAPKKVIKNAPSNVVFTDFLPNEKYGALLRDCDIVICLTINDNTMQNGAYEALIIGRPIITSDWPVLRGLYNKGAVCVDNTPEAIGSAIRLIQAEYPRYLREIRALQTEFKTTWEKKFSALLELLDHCVAGS
jgi:glycosyltransferase involved in cell wall biosynthesis